MKVLSDGQNSGPAVLRRLQYGSFVPPPGWTIGAIVTPKEHAQITIIVLLMEIV